jgi:pantetheine-phosphate adenylyltransferase
MKDLFNRGLVPLSADPITNGHINLIKRAASQCRELIVLIANNDLKSGRYTFTLWERVAMSRRALAHLKSVRVIGYAGLLVDAYLENGCDAIFRGIRNEEDREYESKQMRYHNLILPGVTDHVHYLAAHTSFKDVSSSMVKSFTSHRIDVSPYVPTFVKAALEERLNRTHLVGVTGGIASGKSYVAAQLAKATGGTHINFDALIRELYDEKSQGAQHVRNTLAELLGSEVLMQDGTKVDREVLKARLFAPDCPPEIREQIHELTSPHVMRLYRKALAQVSGMVFVEWAQLAEMNMSDLVNHNVVVVESPDRAMLLKKRGIDADTFAKIDANQWSVDKKVAALQAAAGQAHYGHTVVYQNHLDPKASKAGLEALVQSLTKTFPHLETK